MKYYFYLFIFFCKVCILQKITLPFKKILKKNTSENLINNLFNNELEVNLTIGTPEKNYPVLLKLQQTETFIMNIDSESKNIKIKYNPKESSTYLSKNERLYLHSKIHCSDGYYIRDTFHFGKEKIKGDLFYFILANKENQNITSSGELGLNFDESRLNKDNLYFLKQLQIKNLIAHSVFTLEYNNENEGNLIIGNYPHEYNKTFNKEDLIYSYIETPNIYIHKVFSNNIVIENSTIVKLEYEFGLIEGSEDYYNKIYLQFFGDYLNKNICSKIMVNNMSSYYYTVCNKNIDLQKFPILILQIDPLKYNFTFDYKDLFLEFENKLYFMIVFQLIPDKWILGEIFFKKYQIVFDKEKKIYGLYFKQSSPNKKNFFKFSPWIIVLIFGLLLIISFFLIIYLYRIIKKRRKIRANELEDNFEYLPQLNYQVNN